MAFFKLNFSLGKSLDKIAQLRENNKLPKPGKKKQKRTPKMNNVKLPEEVQEISKMENICTKCYLMQLG